MKNLLAVVLVVSLASVALSQNLLPAAPPAGPGAAAPAARAVANWEYKVSDRGGFNPDAWEKKLNDMAKDGWELDQIDQGEGVYIFRRAVRMAGLPAGMFVVPGFNPAGR